MPLDDQILGMGVYTPKEAARLIGTSSQQVLRWTRGSGPSSPIFDSYYNFIDEDVTEISFLDLIEIRVINALRRANMSLQSIRYAKALAEERFGIVRPFAFRSFKTDGSEILMDALEHDGEFVSLSSKHPGQKVFRMIVKQSLNDLEYDGDLAARWRPLNYSQIVIDPTRNFGTPILDEYGLASNIIFEEFKQFEDLDYLSSIYEVPKSSLMHCINFESSLDEVNN